MTAATLRDQWQAHADRVLPIDAAQATVIAARREWYFARLIELKAQPESPARDALLAEALGFARTIGRAEERATV